MKKSYRQPIKSRVIQKPVQNKFANYDEDENFTDIDEDSEFDEVGSEIDEDNDVKFSDAGSEIDEDEDRELGEDDDREFDDEDLGEDDREIGETDSEFSEDEDRELNEDDRDFDDEGYEYFDPLEQQPSARGRDIILSNADKKLNEEKKLFISVKKIQAKELFQNLLGILDNKYIQFNKADKHQYKEEVREGFLKSIRLSMTGFGKIKDAKPSTYAEQYEAAKSGVPIAREVDYYQYQKTDLDPGQLNELKRLITKAVDKLADEKRAGKNSLEAQTKPNYWWQYMPVVFTVRTIAGMCNSIGKYLGIVSPTSADLFLEAAKYGQRIKNEFEKDQRERNELNRREGSSGPLGDLIKHGRKIMAQDERGVLQLQAEVAAHDHRSKYENRDVFQVTKEKGLVKDGQRYDPRRKKFVDAYVEKDVAKSHVGTRVAQKAGALEKLQAAFRGNLARRHMMSQNLPKVTNVLRSPEWQATHETLESLKELTKDDHKISGYLQELETALIPAGRKAEITQGEKGNAPSSTKRLSIEELANNINQPAIDKILFKLNEKINDRANWYDLVENQESELFAELRDQVGTYIDKVKNRANIYKDMQDGLAELRIEAAKSEDVQKYLKVVEKALFSEGISFSGAKVAGDIDADKVTEALDDLKGIIEQDDNLRKLAKRFNKFNEKMADYLEEMKSRSEEIGAAMQKEAAQVSGDKAALKDYWQEKIAAKKASSIARE